MRLSSHHNRWTEVRSWIKLATRVGDVQVKIDGKAATDQATISTDKNTLTVAFAEKAEWKLMLVSLSK